MRRLWNLPPGPAAALTALHLAEPHAELLGHLSDAQWRGALDFCGRSQITLALRARAREFMPAWVRQEVDGARTRNFERLRITQELYRRLQSRLECEFVALKGLTQCGLFGSEAPDRPQYDIDLYIPREQAFAARDTLIADGYEPMEGMEHFPTDHLPALIRKTGWQYRGDVFDPEMPLPVELHYRFWNGDVERLAAPGVEEFWARRVVRGEFRLPSLCVPDALAYACLHLLKHVLRGNTRPFHVYEIACFLQTHADDEAFWREWRSLHPPRLRMLQAVSFRLAAEWFGCALGPAEGEVAQLPAGARAWFERFALSPASTEFNSNKDELWLHLALLESRRDAIGVARRRLFPHRLPAAVEGVYVPAAQMTWRMRLRKNVSWLRYAASRAAHHAAALPSVLRSGAQLCWATYRDRPPAVY